MKSIKFLFCIQLFFTLSSCKSTVKEQNDKVYSRHLQRYVDLTIITTAMPDKKEEMNLLILNDAKWLQQTRAKEIVDSLYKKKKIQPLLIVATKGVQKDFGLQETVSENAKQFKKYNEFVGEELYPFIKKKTVIRKFNSVGICGFENSALSSFDIAWNNDEKISFAGLFTPSFGSSKAEDSVILKSISDLRKRPELKIWVSTDGTDSTSYSFKQIMDTKKSITECTLNENNKGDFDLQFAAFLLWAYPRR